MAEDSGFSSRLGQEIFIFSSISRPPVGIDKPLLKKYFKIFSHKRSGWCVKLNTILHLVLRLRIDGGIPPFTRVLMAWCLIKQKENYTFLLLHEENIT
jgi:hypothetical protein